MYLMHVMKAKNYQSYLDFKWGATSNELICYDYKLALDNYYDTTAAFEIAREALRKSTNSFAVNIIYNLIKSILPLLISIFILVATRKFKELNQLIEENKNL